MKIQQLLSDRPVCHLDPSRSVLDATKAMVEHHCGSVAVTRGDALVGIFTERDLMVRVVAKGRSPKNTLLEEVMTTDLYTVTADRLVSEVRREMRARHIRHVPVLEKDRILTVLSNRDLLRADYEEQRQDALAMTDYIRRTP